MNCDVWRRCEEGIDGSQTHHPKPSGSFKNWYSSPHGLNIVSLVNGKTNSCHLFAQALEFGVVRYCDFLN